MAKKKGKKKKGASNTTSGPQDSITLRQEITGKIQPKVSNNVKTYLNHLENLASWASGQASIPSLAAFFGQRLAAAAESLAAAPDPSLFPCQRCETILQPGFNCSIRIEKNNAKRRRRHNKCSNLTQNNVAYYCHYCSCRNIKRGTPKCHMKMLYETEFESKVKLVVVKDGKECETAAVKMTGDILTIDAPKIPPTTGDILTVDTPAIPLTTEDILTIDAPAIPPPTGDIPAVDGPVILPPRMEDILTNDAPATPPMSVMTLSNLQKRKMRKLYKKQTGPETSCAPTDAEEKTGDIPTVDAPTTPPTTLEMTLLNSKKRKRKKPSSKNQMEPESSSAPTADKRKRKKKSWTSLKEIAQTNEQSGKQTVAELAIPFSLQGTF